MFFFESFYYFYSLKTKLFYNEMKHIRLIFSAILLSLVVPCGYTQTRQDSLAIAHAQWHTVATRSSMHVHEYTRIRLAPTNFYHKIRS